jgi:type IV secretory pathway protease TraF
VVAYALAFAFHATLAEAFVVPTGAMAPTVLGQHFRVRCPNCGSEVDVGASAATIAYRDWPTIARRGYDCLQCGESRIKIDDDTQLLSGDRVLVDKLDRTPERFQIAVFRVLPEQLENFGGPTQPVNYVKRCVALPGEKLEIFNGDLFIDGQRLQKGPHELEDLWLDVHDTQLAPRRPVDTWPTWQADDAADGWQWKDGRWTVVAGASAAVELTFAGDQADHYAYDLPEDREYGRPAMVRDWRITVDVAKLQGDGALGFFWRDDERETCLAATSRGAVQAFRDVEQFAAAPNDDRGDDIPATASVSQISFAVRDGKAYLSIDGKVLATVDLMPTSLDEARSENDADEGDSHVQFGIVARDVQAEIARIRVHRDVHYRTRHEMDSRMFDEEHDEWQLEREYFFLGDHSPQSQDCRYIGPIHEREIIGVARWCYWPAERMRELGGR